VYVLPGSPPGQLPRGDGWAATWIDEYDEAGEHRERVGTATFEGTRADVLAWARVQPAQARVMPIEAYPGWAPLPDDDAEVGQ
jgi:hypothetical protein